MQTNDVLRKNNNEMTDRERHAAQAQRALEIEKEDILANYREANLQISSLDQTIQMISKENNQLFLMTKDVERGFSGMQYQNKDLQKKEEGYIQEILTLERHIDQLSNQLNLQSVALGEIQLERESLHSQLQSFQNATMHQDQDIRRILSHKDSERVEFLNRISDLRSQISELNKK